MAFPIDVSQPFRFPSELMRLAQGVRQAGANDETVWIEWKSTLDLTSAPGINHVAKQILGFANRDPQVAASWAQGFAYLVVGVGPGDLRGVSAIDPEQLVSKVIPYVGGDVSWTPEYVTIGGCEVLIIVIHPPRPGDQIHVLRKEFQGQKPGTVFIRRAGQTAQANPDEMAMLQRRLLAGAIRVELDVRATCPSIEAQANFPAMFDLWAQKERSRLLAGDALASDDASPSSRGVRLAPWAAVMQGDYEERVDSYLEKMREVQSVRYLRCMFNQESAGLALSIVNSSERNFAQVRVTLGIDGPSVRVFTSTVMDLVRGPEPALPKPPLRPERTVIDFGSSDGPYRLLPPGMHLTALAPDFVPDISRYGWEADMTDDGAVIAFEPRDIRPYETLILPTVPLVVSATSQSPLEVNWTATATNVDGRSVGTCCITVGESTLDAGQLFG